jgi:hypothetical protein
VTYVTFHNIWHSHYIIAGHKYIEGSNFLVGADTCDVSKTVAASKVGFRSLKY